MPVLIHQWLDDINARYQVLYYDMTTECFMCLHGTACPKRREPLPFDVGDVYVPLGFAGMGGRTPPINYRLRLAAETPVPTS
jgi:hypothetical protein